ncbi:anti-sigma regulatory factor (Ser/Thr protein kinase) [Actinocorallia herbida]|uniref:Anti-sigma regulatory factor (Ser/Thr protein kinase) n=2 Tax=Actinocorallia herbida TaxID=58109 RepID=A0A3N1D1N9_9ACTN|nr:anti-sigma regulatory factor (Ser/Thr protein kinase) [Actinocorallia herbida]
MPDEEDGCLSGEEVGRLDLRADARAPRLVRRWLRSFVDDAGTLELLASEVVTNSVLHGPDAVISVVLRRSTKTIRFECTDQGQGTPTGRNAAETDEDGRGLLLLSALARTWSAETTMTGTTVWFELAPS